MITNENQYIVDCRPARRQIAWRRPLLRRESWRTKLYCANRWTKTRARPASPTLLILTRKQVLSKSPQRTISVFAETILGYSCALFPLSSTHTCYRCLDLGCFGGQKNYVEHLLFLRTNLGNIVLLAFMTYMLNDSIQSCSQIFPQIKPHLK